MKTAALSLLTLAALAGCVVVPAEPPVVVGPPRAYVAPPVVVVPGRPYYRHGYDGRHDWHHRRHHWRD